MIRRPAVAGTFYPGTARALRGQVEDLLARGPRERALAAVAPHAGYMYSGRVAGEVYGALEPAEVYVILGPNHTGLGAGAAIVTEGTWATPLGEMAIETALARAIRQASDVLEEDDLAHLKEHAIEVQLPFLQLQDPAPTFVPSCLMSHEIAACQDVGAAVAEAVAAYPKRVVVVASTDLNHYEPQAVAERKDGLAIEQMLALDAVGLHRTVRQNRISMCGFHPTTAVLLAAKALGATAARLVRHMTSGDVNHDYSRVVGYAGIIIR
ncbi:MAG: AmmeMemoRadiSam system protein B [candidate division NC10 bacterium]|nr:AmmeMemoRadiSam system protein B [candidate division NC10 bacterium]